MRVGTYVCAYMCHVYGGQRSALGVHFPSGSLPWFSHSYLEFPNSASPLVTKPQVASLPSARIARVHMPSGY